MSTGTANEILAYWLIPAEPALSYFRSFIRDLATRFEAPEFEPHLTLYATKAGNDNPTIVLEDALPNFQPLRLAIAGIDYSDEFTKTLFVQFRPDETLARLSGKLRSASIAPCEYQLNPHLSLIYKKMTRDARIAVAAAIRLPFSEVLFDSAKAIVSPAPITTREDVEAWREGIAQKLGK